MYKDFQIKDIAVLNHSSRTSLEKTSYINYLDTGSITKNKIDKLQLLNDNLPSRAKRKVKEKTIIYSTVRPNQEHFGIIENISDVKNIIVSTGFTTIDVISNEVDPKYLYFLISQKPITNYLHTIAEGAVSAYPSINPSDLGNLKFSVPDLLTQQKIAGVLTAFENKIQVNEEINAKLESMTKTLYDYWFLQFDFPDKNGNPYKSSGGKLVYDEKLNRTIPEGWSSESLAYFIVKDKSGDWGKERAEGNYTIKVECIRGSDINGINGKDEVKTPIRFILEKNANKVLAYNELVIEISGGSPTQSTGRLACITAEVSERFENPLICSNFCKAVSLISEEVVFYFTHSWNRAYDNGVFFGFEGKTSGIKNLLFDSLVTNYHIPLPDKNLLKRFQEKVSLFEKQKQNNLKQNKELSALHDWLLPMLMNGQIKVEQTAKG